MHWIEFYFEATQAGFSCVTDGFGGVGMSEYSDVWFITCDSTSSVYACEGDRKSVV